MAGKCTEEELAEYREAFALFDKNGDGFINATELKAIMKSLGTDASDYEIDLMIKEVDTDHDMKINFMEFLSMMSANMQKHKKAIPNELHTVFNLFDRDGDGFITMTELKSALTDLGENMSDTEVEEMMHMADTNCDGKISYDEFLAVMCQKK